MKELRVTFHFKDGNIGAIRHYISAELAVKDIKELYRQYKSTIPDEIAAIRVNGIKFGTPPGVRALRKLLGTTA